MVYINMILPMKSLHISYTNTVKHNITTSFHNVIYLMIATFFENMFHAFVVYNGILVRQLWKHIK